MTAIEWQQAVPGETQCRSCRRVFVSRTAVNAHTCHAKHGPAPSARDRPFSWLGCAAGNNVAGTFC